MTTPPPISHMAAGDLRDLIAAIESGDRPAAAYALASIDPTSWAAINTRLTTLGSSLAALIATAGGEHQ